MRKVQKKHELKKKLTLMVVPHSGQEIRSIELTIPVFIAAVFIFAVVLFSSVFFPYKYFESVVRFKQDESYLKGQEKQYTALSENIKKSSDISSEFSAELEKTIKILSFSDANSRQKSSAASAFQAVYSGDNYSYSEFDQMKPLLTITEQLNRNIPILRDIGISLKTQSKLMRSLPVYWPVPNSVVTMEWGPNIHPVLGHWYLHKGIDLAAIPGSPIYAVADGVVTETGLDLSYGLNVYVSHKHGFKSHYSHMSAISVSKGQMVAQGQRLGAVGSTGVATGPHLDLQLYLGEDLLDPGIFMRMFNASKYSRPIGNR